MVHTIALGPNETDVVRMGRSKFHFRTYDITAYTNRRVVTATFVDGGGGDDTITRAAGSWVTDGFTTGTVIITGTASNNATYTITGVVALTLTFATGTVTAEAAVSATFAAGTGLAANVGEPITPAELGVSVIDGIFPTSSELNTHTLRWDRTLNSLVMLTEAYVEPVDATNGGTWQLIIVGY